MAVLTTLNEKLKSGDVTVAGSRRWTDFEDYLIPRADWERERERHYALLGLPLSLDIFLEHLQQKLDETTVQVESRVARNAALTIDSHKGCFRLAALRGEEKPPAVHALKNVVEAQMLRTDLVDLLIDMDNLVDFLRHFLPVGGELSRLPPPHRRRNILAALIAVGCNIGPHRMAAASPGIGFREISQIADWYFTEEALKAASVDLVNFASQLPLSQLWGKGDTCSADGMRFHVPLNILSADYSPVLGARGVTLLAHTADNFLRLSHKAIPCRLREATFCLDGLLEHDTELDPKVCYTDTHGATEVIMATGALLGFELAPRLKDIKDQTLYRWDKTRNYPRLDPILTGYLQPHRIRQAWDETIRVIASIRSRRVSASLILHRLGSYARQNSVHQALAEMGRVYKTIFLLKYLDDEDLRRHIGQELNKGENSHALSRFLCFGKEGTIRSREFEDQVHTFSCLAVLHNAVIAWNTNQMMQVVERLRKHGHLILDEHLMQITPLMRRHINPFGQYHFDLARMRGGQRGPQ
jgi:TnpA family transposase